MINKTWYIYTQLYSVYSTCYCQLVKGILLIKRTWSSANRTDSIGSLGTGWFLFRIGGWWICGNKNRGFSLKKKKTTRFPRAKWHHVQRRNVGCVEHRRLVPAIFLEGIGWVWKEKHHENLRFQRLVRLMIYLWYLTFVYLWVMRTLDVWWQQWRWSMFDGWLKLSLAVGESPGKYHS